tara:strand:- start:186 stop:656 length:471 start_codon:yes stop_codon:yes gene_type:complete
MHFLVRKENIYYIAFIFFIFYLDRFSKNQILNNFSEKVFYINEFLNLDLIWNTGIGFGLLSTDSTLIYNIVTLVIGTVIIILIYILLISQTIDKIIYCVILGGALGNFYDRIVFKAVPDFIDLHYNNFHWFTFNVADVFISLGIIFYICKSFYIKN